ncbi:MAG TPA: SCO family protein [Rubricoccaceae bacterium]|nr:SCO family protein [Rubricoccaceae bacterium]
MTASGRLRFFLALAVLLVGAGPGVAQPAEPAAPASDPAAGLPAVAREVAIVERLGARVPPGLTFRDSEGRAVQLGQLLGQDKPVVLAFVYHTCPSLCSFVLDGYADALRETALAPGEDFEAVAVSIDPRDTPERAAQAKARYVGEVNRPGLENAWHFWTGEPAQVRALAETVGFGYRWDPATQQYAHGAALVFLSPDGTVARYLYGITFPPRDFRLAAVEASEGRVGSTLDRLLLTCYKFDADSRSYVPVAVNIMKLGGAAFVLVLGLVLAVFWRRERHRQAVPDPLP